MELPSNLLTNIPAELPAELVETLLASSHCRIERIVSRGHASPDGFWYDQTEHEWVLLIQGSARVRFDTKTIDLKSGDWLHIPAHQRHRLEQTDPAQATIWLAVFYWE